MDAAVALWLRHPRIMRVASHADLFLGRDRYHAAQEVFDALPIGIGGNWSSLRQLVLVGGFLVVPSRVGALAPARCPSDADNTKDAHVVLDGRNARLGAVADHLLAHLDLPVALRVLAHHDGGHRGFGDHRRGQRDRHHVEGDAMFFDPFTQSGEAVDRPTRVQLRAEIGAAYVVDAE